MSKLREAAQQALEALESHPYDDRHWVEECQPAITALKAALAEPQEPNLSRCPNCNGPADNGHDREVPPNPYLCTKCMAELTTEEFLAVEPVQEPVAKVELMTTGGNAGLATRIVEIDDHLRERLRPGQMLYTHPAPQRQPLTQYEAWEIWDALADRGKKGEDIVHAFARAIEDAVWEKINGNKT